MGVEITLTAELHSDNLSDGLSQSVSYLRHTTTLVLSQMAAHLFGLMTTKF